MEVLSASSSLSRPYTAIGEFERRLGREDAARRAFEKALELSRSPEEKKLLAGRVERRASGAT